MTSMPLIWLLITVNICTMAGLFERGGKDQLQGNWIVVEQTCGPDSSFNGVCDVEEIVIIGKRCILSGHSSFGNEVELDATFNVKTLGRAHVIDIICGKSRLYHGVYLIDGDRLLIRCSIDAGAPRLVEFAAQPSTRTIFLVCKRQRR